MHAVMDRMGRIKSRFLRALIEAVEPDPTGGALRRLRYGLPPHWLRVLSRDIFGLVEADATLDLDSGIELLLAIERVLSGGSGAVMVRASGALAARVLARSPGLVVPGDLVRTLQHLRAPFEQPFVDVELGFSVQGTAIGFVLETELPGQPSAARWLGWAGLGYAQAAASFSGHAVSQFRFETKLAADLARITGRRTNTGLVELPASRPPAAASDAQGRAIRRRTPPTNAAARVDQILSRVPSGSLRGARDSEAPSAPRSHEPRASQPPQSASAPGSGTRLAVRETSSPPARKSVR
jgi:hypothetical protein